MHSFAEGYNNIARGACKELDIEEAEMKLRSAAADVRDILDTTKTTMFLVSVASLIDCLVAFSTVAIVTEENIP